MKWYVQTIAITIEIAEQEREHTRSTKQSKLHLIIPSLKGGREGRLGISSNDSKDYRLKRHFELSVQDQCFLMVTHSSKPAACEKLSLTR